MRKNKVSALSLATLNCRRKRQDRRAEYRQDPNRARKQVTIKRKTALVWTKKEINTKVTFGSVRAVLTHGQSVERWHKKLLEGEELALRCPPPRKVEEPALWAPPPKEQ